MFTRFQFKSKCAFRTQEYFSCGVIWNSYRQKKIMNGHYLLVCVSIVVATEGRPDGVRGCGTPDASFIPAHGDSPHNESLPIYIRALRNGTDWSGTQDNFQVQF